MKGIIYQITNTNTGMQYIGATTNSLDKRRQDQIERAKRGENSKLYNAIATYGEAAFNWIQIDTADSMDELAFKEKQYVYNYNTKENGYNSDEGGGLKKTVYKYRISDGKLVDEFSCLDLAAKSIDSSKQHISRACIGINKMYGGYYWSYQFVEPFVPKKDSRKKEVYQLTLDGNLLAKYVSVSEASRLTGLSKTCISRVCRGERLKSGGYVWKYIK